MTKKHFVQMAQTLVIERKYGKFSKLTKAQYADVVDVLASICKESNPAFDRSRFVAACQPDESK